MAVILCLLMSSCGDTVMHDNSENQAAGNENTDSVTYSGEDVSKTIVADGKDSNDKMTASTGDHRNSKNINRTTVKSQVITRYIEFPGENNWNGKPMTQQLDFPKLFLKTYPDTLSRLAVARYKTYDNFFPKAIADNFEEGVSEEHVVYPKKIIFRFELFEDEFSEKAYATKEITVRRNEMGQPYAE